MKNFFDRFAVYFFAAALLLCACFSDAQTVSPFMGIGNAQFFDNNGAPLTAGVLYSYQAGTTTQQATYTDYTGLTQNPNPIPFSSGARVTIWLTSTASYKFVLCLQNDGAACAPADVLFSMDHVPGGATGGGTSPFTGIFISNSPLPATTGILELASIDSICWRNTANNANLCISKDASDVLTWTGATIKFPETSCTVTAAGGDYLCPNSATHRLSVSNNNGGYQSIPGIATAGTSGHLVDLASNGIDLTDSGATPPATLTVPFSATPTFTPTSQDQLYLMTLTGDVTSSTLVMSGLPVPSHIAFNLTQDGSGGHAFTWPANVIGAIPPNQGAGSVTTYDFIWGGVNARAVTLAPVLPAIQANSVTQASGNVTVPASTDTTVLTKSVTMPGSGCPCRALVSYGMFLQTGNAGIDVGWVDDGTNQFGTAQVLVTGSASAYGLNGTSLSTGTYANNASVTFTLKIQASNSGGINVLQSSNRPGPQSTWLNVAIFTSN